jgi:hypothetical protein
MDLGVSHVSLCANSCFSSKHREGNDDSTALMRRRNAVLLDCRAAHAPKFLPLTTFPQASFSRIERRN